MIKRNVLLAALLLCLCLMFAGCNILRGNSQSESSETVQQQTSDAPTTQEQSTAHTTTVPENDISYIDELISKMSVEEKVGQMFIVRCPEFSAAETVVEYQLGGYILFGRDFESKTSEEIVRDIHSYQQVADIPMLIGTDEEGGTVVRVSCNPNLRDSEFLSPSDTFANGGWSAIEEDAREKADLLLSLGVNVNMAPDCDITSDPNAFMYYRSFSPNVDNECRFVSTVVSISKDKKLGTVLKHFPGYGNNEDTHTGIAYDNRDYTDFENIDFKPFREGIEAGADCILVAHNIVSCMDGEYPASLSENVHRIIRGELNFDGVIMTDDLSMEAITDYTGGAEAAVIAAKCGNDMLCCTDVETQYPAVLTAVKNGEIPIEQINESVRRILIWKNNLGLFDE